ncbi:MAG: TetR/AcrR family transcriptional regulator [Actinomycetota bacterium]
MSTEVNPQMSPGSRKAAQGQATREALLQAARKLFGEQGYAGTSTEDVVAQAGVTKGALYHHFEGKPDLFRAVFEQLKHEISDQVAEVFMERDPWRALSGGCQSVVDAQLDPAVRRIVLHDARSVLGWETVRDVDNRYGAVALRGALRKAMRAGVLREEPLRPLALLLTGALSEACFYVADADDPAAARREVGDLVTAMLEAFRPSAANA